MTEVTIKKRNQISFVVPNRNISLNLNSKTPQQPFPYNSRNVPRHVDGVNHMLQQCFYWSNRLDDVGRANWRYKIQNHNSRSDLKNIHFQFGERNGFAKELEASIEINTGNVPLCTLQRLPSSAPAVSESKMAQKLHNRPIMQNMQMRIVRSVLWDFL